MCNFTVCVQPIYIKQFNPRGAGGGGGDYLEPFWFFKLYLTNALDVVR